MLSWKLIEVQEQTLRHVARDLHDHFGQILTAIGLMLGRAGKKAAETDPVFVQDVRAAKKIVEDTLQSVRDESQIFRPAILDDFGLQQTLEWFAEQFSRQTGCAGALRGKACGRTFPSRGGHPRLSHRAGSAEQRGAPFRRAGSLGDAGRKR